MKIFGWDKDFEVGIKKFDENNKIIIVLLNQLVKILHEEQMNPEFHKIFATLLLYARKEFDLEESFMKKTHYKLATLHINQHNEFMNRMDHFSNQYLMGEKPAFEFHKYALKWVENHIKITDKKFIPTVKDYILNSFEENF